VIIVGFMDTWKSRGTMLIFYRFSRCTNTLPQLVYSQHC